MAQRRPALGPSRPTPVVPLHPATRSSRLMRDAAPVTHTNATATQHSTPLVKPKRKRIRLKTERRREQCRRNQARYPDRQRLQVLELETEVDDLRAEVERLEEQRRSLYYSVNLRDASAKVVMEYFRLFRHGLDIDRHVRAPLIPPLVRQRQSALLTKQFSFLETVVADNVRVDEVFGRDIFIDQTKCYATYYDDTLLRLHTLDCVSIGAEAVTTVHVTHILELTITPTTIRRVFPHVHDKAQLKWKLLGYRLRCPASGTFVFNEEQTASSVDWTIDSVTGLLNIQTIEEVGFVLQDAQIVRDAYLISDKHDGTSSNIPARECSYDRGPFQLDEAMESRQPPPPFVFRQEDGAVMMHDGKEGDVVML
ncbi:hypothetical protein Poli38472_011795 [Pythium oligandrum]|uniref:BZIP domain-containing protein n=1 Tax=Pythium oligandrum TaxID=41045 RepID=A0A8K1C7X0_PYTOL|nr:hypothetical protein Poli38472_011795 [Pythium oligandrum]|eukprot:TMW58207.1 hypothetical protein Poli38472_011795 [Pythium oligandrum]